MFLNILRNILGYGIDSPVKIKKVALLSAEAQEAGVANMSLDEINAEIDAARNGK